MNHLEIDGLEVSVFTAHLKTGMTKWGWKTEPPTRVLLHEPGTRDSAIRLLCSFRGMATNRLL